jgi:MFS family permease
VLATIAATLTGEHRLRAFGLFGAAGGIAAAAGQIIGGALATADIFGLGWRSVFLMNVPIGIVAWVVARRMLPETKADKKLPMDALGAAILAVLLVLLMLPLTEGRPLGWPTWTWVLLGATIPVLIVLAVYQARTERAGRTPLVPPSVLALPAMRLGLLIGLAYFTTFGGFMFAFALATQGQAGMSALEGGLTLLPMAAAFMVVSISLPRLQRRWGPGIIVRGWFGQLVGYGLLAVMLQRQWPDITPLSLALPMAVAGIGGALVMMPLFGVVLEQVPGHQAGLGSGILITTQQTCLALGAATIGTLFLTWSDSTGDQGQGLTAVLVVIVVIAALALVPSLMLNRSPASEESA